jgi:hypothetical protein
MGVWELIFRLTGTTHLELTPKLNDITLWFQELNKKDSGIVSAFNFLKFVLDSAAVQTG